MFQLTEEQFITNHHTPTDDGIYIGIWNSIENDFVLSAACLPAVPPVIRLFKSKIPTRKQAAPGSSVPNPNAKFRKLKNDSKLSLQTVGSFQRHGQLRTCIQHTRRLFHRTIAALRTRSPELNCLPPPSSETRPAISSWCNVARLKLSTFECI